MSDVEQMAEKSYWLLEKKKVYSLHVHHVEGFKNGFECGELAEREKQYAPGILKCAKCDCAVISKTINMQSGTMSADAEPKKCPNGCGPMWRVTWKEYSKITDKELDSCFNAGQKSPAVKALLEWIGPCVCDPSTGLAAICGSCQAVRDYEDATKEPS